MKHAAFLFLLFPAAQAAGADTLDALSGDGWYSWRAAAVDDVPAWCCADGPSDHASQGCNLDSRMHGYTTCAGGIPDGRHVALYARIDSGAVVQLRVLGPDCPVYAEDPVADLGTIDARESFEWLRHLVLDGSDVEEDALAAIAMHRGDEPLKFLADSANGALDGELRESAIFWLGRLHVAEGARVLERLMLLDRNADIRRHSAFVLAQSGADGSEAAIMKAVTGDPDRGVREEAVFALSQLPGERAVDALLDIVEDRQLEHEVRKAALFWLVQSESDRAFASVERLLGDGSSR